ncbi:DnaJ domain-containing protein [Pilobolus umbonatus]|nr:DnaJ domain-containing protein [Pilobolus umbonatus]
MRMFRRSLHTSTTCYKKHYDTLQLKLSADKRAIRTNYYKLSKKYHPDLNPNNKEAHKKFIEINEAYAILGNEANKKVYDAEHTPEATIANSGFGRGSTAYSHAWRYRHKAKTATGSKSAQKQAADMREEEVKFNASDHYNKHYEGEEERRRQRVERAANRRRAAGEIVINDTSIINKEKEGVTGRLWRVGVVLTAIAYATKILSQ